MALAGAAFPVLGVVFFADLVRDGRRQRRPAGVR